MKLQFRPESFLWTNGVCLLALLQILTAVLSGAVDAYTDNSDELWAEIPVELPMTDEAFDGFRDFAGYTKRHLGAFTKTKGVGPYQIMPTGKRHLGSFASSSISGLKAQFGAIQPGKRHFGAIASKSGLPGKRNLAALAKINSKPLKRDFDIDEIDDSEDEMLYDMASVPEIWNDNTVEPGTSKTKRFLGSMVRGGWFPRQFRGFVADNPYDKRHIGSAARVGWVPFSKVAPDSLLDYGERNGFKRNLQSLRRFQTEPNTSWGWGRQREKRGIPTL